MWPSLASCEKNHAYCSWFTSTSTMWANNASEASPFSGDHENAKVDHNLRWEFWMTLRLNSLNAATGETNVEIVLCSWQFSKFGCFFLSCKPSLFSVSLKIVIFVIEPYFESPVLYDCWDYSFYLVYLTCLTTSYFGHPNLALFIVQNLAMSKQRAGCLYFFLEERLNSWGFCLWCKRLWVVLEMESLMILVIFVMH